MSLIQRAAGSVPAPPKPEAPDVRPAAAARPPDPADGDTLPPRELNLALRLSAGVIYLWVQNTTDEGCRAFAGYEGGRLESQVLRPKRPIDRKTLDPQAVWEMMLTFAEGQGDLVCWLDEIICAFRDVHKRPPVLIIVDHSDSAVPWEMLPLHLETYKALGSETVAVRWATFRAADFRVVRLHDDGDVCAGNVLTHLDPKEADSAREAGVAAGLPLPDPVATNHDDIRTLFRHLTTEVADVGFVYLLCHGFVEGGPGDIALGSEDETRRVRRVDYLPRRFELFAKSRAVVFLNACRAAAAVREREYVCDGSQASLAGLFIGKGARGVIGPLDTVYLLPAVDTARAFVDLIKANPTIPVAEALRRLRERALRHLAEAPTDRKRYAHWYHTFLYVFYGHPGTRLRFGRTEVDDA